MGRLAKYKKIKSCDPYSKKNCGKQSMTGVWGWDDNGRRAKSRSKTATRLKQQQQKKTKKKKNDSQEEDALFDLAPTGGDDFVLSDLMSVKKSKPQENLFEDNEMKKLKIVKVAIPKTTNAVDEDGNDEPEEESASTRNLIVPDPLLEETRANRILNIQEPHDGNAKAKVERLAGESRKAFEKRYKSETRQLIRNEKLQERNPEKRQRKKDFLNQKKEKKRKRNGDKSQEETWYDEGNHPGKEWSATVSNDGFVTGEQAVAQVVAFGEQVDRPPVFHQRPRGAPEKLTMKQKPSQNKSDSIDAHQRGMENMRRKVQAQYQLLKAKRKKAGDFHL